MPLNTLNRACYHLPIHTTVHAIIFLTLNRACYHLPHTQLLSILKQTYRAPIETYYSAALPEKDADPIYKGNDAKAPLADGEEIKKKKEGEDEPKPAPSARKEKSVLQAKLTKLAIQIGYAGKDNV